MKQGQVNNVKRHFEDMLVLLKNRVTQRTSTTGGGTPRTGQTFELKRLMHQKDLQ
jgi:hypothetical protein